MTLTRESLRDGFIQKMVSEAETLGLIRALTEAERAASLEAALKGYDPTQDVWVFGYGSLMWNPVIRFAEERRGTVYGYHRRYCIWTASGRGSPDCPGLMLALERGGSCRGLAFRIAAEEREEELGLLWRREMVGGSYQARQVTVQTTKGPIQALTFIINRSHRRYTGPLDHDRIAAHVARAAGRLGTCLEYLTKTVDQLDALGMSRTPMHDILRRVHAYEGAGPEGRWEDGSWHPK